MHRRFLTAAALVLVVALATLTAPAALAGKSRIQVSRDTYSYSGTMPDGGLPCLFAVQVGYQGLDKYTDVTFKNGVTTEIGHWSENDVFSANGRTLVGNTTSWIKRGCFA